MARSRTRNVKKTEPVSTNPPDSPPAVFVGRDDEFDPEPFAEQMDGPPVPQIDRRHMPRVSYQTLAFLAPADEHGAMRIPVIRTRDVNLTGLGFVARQDFSALGEAILKLPNKAGRTVMVACRVRRSLEMGDGWFDGLLEFLTPQPQLAAPAPSSARKPVRRRSAGHKAKRT